MFKRRTIRKKKRNRKTWYRPRFNKKEKLTEKTDFNEGQTKITKEDIIVGNGGDQYRWTAIVPNGGGIVDANELKQDFHGKIRTLKMLCAAKIAENIESLDTSYLNYGTWSVWSMVWDEVLLRSMDSFNVYSMFASKFGRVKDFKPHLIRRYLDRTLNEYELLQMTRNKAIDLFKIPKCNHRIENLFSNVNLAKLGKTLSSLIFNPLIIIDLLLVGNDPQLVAIDNPSILYNIHQLLALNLSNNSIIDDNYIFNLCLRLKNSTTSKLTMIILNNCPRISKTGIQYLIDLADQNPRCCLSYIECDHNMVLTEFNRQFESKLNGGTYDTYIEGTTWLKLDRDRYEIDLIFNLPLALKLNSLCRLFKDILIPKVNSTKFSFIEHLREEIIVDIMLHSQVYKQETLVQDLISIWTSRMNQRFSSKHTGYCYMINHNFTKSQTKSIPTKPQNESKPLFEQRVPTSRRTTTKSITTNASNFFANSS